MNENSYQANKLPQSFKLDDDDDERINVIISSSDNDENGKLTSTKTTTSNAHTLIKAKKRKANTTVNEMVNDMKGDLEHDHRYEQPSSLQSSHGSNSHSDTEETNTITTNSEKNGNIQLSLVAAVSETKTVKKFLSKETTDYLLKFYEEENDSPSLEERRLIATKMNLKIDTITRWFSNRRQRLMAKNNDSIKSRGRKSNLNLMKNCTVSLTEINVNSNNALKSFTQENKTIITSNETSLLFDNGKSKSRKRKNETQYDQKDTSINNKNITSSNHQTNINNNDSSFINERPSKKSRIEIKSSNYTINQNKNMPGTPNKALRRITLGPAQLGPSVDLYLSNSAKKKQQEAEAQMQVSPKRMKQLPRTKLPKKETVETSVKSGRRNSLAVLSSNIDLKPSKKYAQKIENSPSMQIINIPKPITSTKRKSLPTTKTNDVTAMTKSSKVNTSSPNTRNKNISKLVNPKTTPVVPKRKSLSADSKPLTIKKNEKVAPTKRKSLSAEPAPPLRRSARKSLVPGQTEYKQLPQPILTKRTKALIDESNNSKLVAKPISPQTPISKRRKSLPVESKKKTEPPQTKKKQKPTTKCKSSESFIADEATSNQKTYTSKILQNVACFEISQSMGANYCRECSTSKQPSHRDDCRFVGWRQLNEAHCADKRNNFLSEKDVTDDDKKLWMPQENFNLFTSTSSKVSDLYKFVRIAGNIREPFEKIWSEEFDAMRRVKDESNKHKICWKRLLEQTREACDQCKTHIFNVHFACRKCGFAICLSCYDDREKNNKSIGTKNKKEVDDKGWLFCQAKNAGEKSIANKKRVKHELDEMMICYFIPLEVFDFMSNQFSVLFNKAEEIKESPEHQTETFDTSRFTTKLGSDDAKFILIDSKPKLGDTHAQEENEFNIFKIFDLEWQRGDSGQRVPIVMKNVDKRMTSDLWSSEWFKKKFSGKDDIDVDLINCENGREIKSIPMSFFWSGFDKVGDKVLEDPVTKKVFKILKLKDWPPAKDFKVVLQDQYYDLMGNLPVKEYCNRDGTLNLAANVPEHFLKPDLGPKLYIAYSSADTPKAGTTNLHIDISDAFNVIMYVGENSEIDEEKFRKMIPKTKIDTATPIVNNEANNKKFDYMLEYLRYSGISEDQIKRYTENKERPGAIWQIFKPDDADKIRTYLFESESKKISKYAKNLDKITSGDLIHDQRFYLDARMLADLKVNYNVTPYTILQFVGDAIFIPAGAPHQVRNVNSCIKVADDFVTPQNIDRCMRTANELRGLTDKHNNREDKLQVKNIIYYALLECMSFFKVFDKK